MPPRRPPSPRALRDLVRRVLGCACPEDVLRSIERRPAHPVPGLGDVTRLDVGGRLLVYLAPAGPREAVAAAVAAGIEERDLCGFNRFRLVLVGDGLGELTRAAEAASADAIAGDDRTHVHVLPRARLPFAYTTSTVP